MRWHFFALTLLIAVPSIVGAHPADEDCNARRVEDPDAKTCDEHWADIQAANNDVFMMGPLGVECAPFDTNQVREYAFITPKPTPEKIVTSGNSGYMDTGVVDYKPCFWFATYPTQANVAQYCGAFNVEDALENSCSEGEENEVCMKVVYPANADEIEWHLDLSHTVPFPDLVECPRYESPDPDPLPGPEASPGKKTK